MAAVGQHHDKRPGLAPCLGGRVEHIAGVTEVNLGFLTGSPFNAHGRLGLGWRQLMQEAVDRGETAGVAAFFETLPDGAAFDTGVGKLDDDLAIRLDGGDDLRRRRCRQCGRDEGLEFLKWRERSLEQAMGGSPALVALNGAAVEAGGALNSADVGCGL